MTTPRPGRPDPATAPDDAAKYPKGYGRDEGDLAGTTDDEILAVAAAESRLLVSHGVNTMTAAFNARVAAGTAVPGLVLVPQKLAVGSAILDLELICRATEPADWGRIEFLPL